MPVPSPARIRVCVVISITPFIRRAGPGRCLRRHGDRCSRSRLRSRVGGARRKASRRWGPSGRRFRRVSWWWSSSLLLCRGARPGCVCDRGRISVAWSVDAGSAARVERGPGAGADAGGLLHRSLSRSGDRISRRWGPSLRPRRRAPSSLSSSPGSAVARAAAASADGAHPRPLAGADVRRRVHLSPPWCQPPPEPPCGQSPGPSPARTCVVWFIGSSP